MADQIVVKIIYVHNSHLIDRGKISKPLNVEITIGHDKGNDIELSGQARVSGKHGKIFLEKGFFSEHLDYEDFSRYGTVVHHLKGNSLQKAETVHNRKTKIKPYDAILMLDEGRRFGFVLVPYIPTLSSFLKIRKRLKYLDNAI